MIVIMKIYHQNVYVFTCISALLYALSLIFIDTLWFCAALFIVPLYVLWLQKSPQLSYKVGFLWGFVTYSLQTSALLLFMYERSVSFYGFIVPFVTLFCMSCSSAVWFFMMKTLYKVSLKIRIMLMVGCTILFFMWMRSGVLCCLVGSLRGYPFSFPLIPFFYKSICIQNCVWNMGGYLTLVMLLFFQLLVAVKKYKICAVLLVVLGGSEFYSVQHQKKEQSLVYCIAIPEVLAAGPYERAVQITELIIDAQFNYPKVHIFVLPESIFPFYEDDEHRLLLRMIADACCTENYILCGIYRIVQGKRFNSSLVIYKGQIIYCYDKKLLVPFFEYVPPYWGDMLFAINGVAFSSGGSELKEEWDLGPYGKVWPQICAELFWSDAQVSAKVIGFVNDSHFSCTYFPKIMRAYAYLKAAELKQCLVYSSYTKK